MKIKYLLVLPLLAALVACGNKNETAETAGDSTAKAAETTAKAAAESKEATTEAAAENTAATQTTGAPVEAGEEEVLAALPEDHPGAELHMEKCESCHIANHDEAFYTRADRKVDSYERLGRMVQACDEQLGTALFDEDIDAITEYLNTTYYKFPAN